MRAPRGPGQLLRTIPPRLNPIVRREGGYLNRVKGQFLISGAPWARNGPGIYYLDVNATDTWEEAVAAVMVNTEAGE